MKRQVPKPERSPSPSRPDGPSSLVERHLTIGWRTVLVFSVLGVGLETMHAWKVAWYLDVGNETRRLLWTLAHAHGVLLGILNLAFSWTIERRTLPTRRLALASTCLLAATVALPAGFLLGGSAVHGGDPGLGIVLVPAGAVFLLVALAAIVS